MARYHPQRVKRIGRSAEETKAEVLLWNELRSQSHDQFSFRRQSPIQGYLVDFYCLRANLIVQIESACPEQNLYDLSLNRLLENLGYRVLRIATGSITLDPQAVADAVLVECEKLFMMDLTQRSLYASQNPI